MCLRVQSRPHKAQNSLCNSAGELSDTGITANVQTMHLDVSLQRCLLQREGGYDIVYGQSPHQRAPCTTHRQLGQVHLCREEVRNFKSGAEVVKGADTHSGGSHA